MGGRVKSQGDRAMRSDVARQLFGLTGQGITIGIISDSFDALRGAGRDVRSGELPGLRNPLGFRQSVRVLKDSQSGSDEGRAMAQIIYDVAPGARLLFHRSGRTETDFANAIRSLAEAGADVIVDDIGYPTGRMLQDGIAAQTVDEVTRQGVLYFSAAGNDGNRSYERSFVPSNSFPYRGTTYIAHNFAAAKNSARAENSTGAVNSTEISVDLFQDIKIPASTPISLLLNWDQPAGQLGSDMEMFLLDRPVLPGQGSSILAQGVVPAYGGVNPAAQNDPAKILVYSNQQSTPQTVYLMLATRTPASSPSPSFVKWISAANSADGDTVYQYVNDLPNAIGSSTIYGHPNATGAIAVGSAFYRRTPAFGANLPRLDNFSSRGGAPIFFSPTGERLTGAQVRLKPEIVGPNGVSTTVFGFSPFFGTSAAAPHLAAVAALMLQRAGGKGSLTLSRLMADLQKTAVPMKAAAGLSPQAGFVQAEQAVLESFQFQQIGTTRSDRLHGTAQADNLLGLEGADRLVGSGGFDWLNGGTGADRLRGNEGNDLLVGEQGNDTLLGNAGNDTLLGDAGNDTLVGGKGADLLSGSRGRNRLIDREGKNTFVLNRRGFARIPYFRPGRDRIALQHSRSGQADRLSLDQIPFKRLTISQQGQDTLIQLGNRTLATLETTDATLLTRQTFVGVSLPQAID